MNNTERLEFLKEKPIYFCIPRRNEHEFGCSCKIWTTKDLQRALDMAKRALELRMFEDNEKLRDNK